MLENIEYCYHCKQLLLCATKMVFLLQFVTTEKTGDKISSRGVLVSLPAGVSSTRHVPTRAPVLPH